MSDYQCGSLLTNPTGVIADRAAREVLAYARPRAVTVDDRGVVFVEPVNTIAESDLVGVYAPDLGILELTKRISGDLLLMKQERNFCRNPRRVVRKAA